MAATSKGRARRGRSAALLALLLLCLFALLCGCGSRTVESVELACGPTRTVYNIGDSFNPDGAYYLIRYSDGSEELRPAAAEDIAGSPLLSSGEGGLAQVTLVCSADGTAYAFNIRVVVRDRDAEALVEYAARIESLRRDYAESEPGVAALAAAALEEFDGGSVTDPAARYERLLDDIETYHSLRAEEKIAEAAARAEEEQRKAEEAQAAAAAAEERRQMVTAAALCNQKIAAIGAPPSVTLSSLAALNAADEAVEAWRQTYGVEAGDEDDALLLLADLSAAHEAYDAAYARAEEMKAEWLAAVGEMDGKANQALYEAYRPARALYRAFEEDFPGQAAEWLDDSRYTEYEAALAQKTNRERYTLYYTWAVGVGAENADLRAALVALPDYTEYSEYGVSADSDAYYTLRLLEIDRLLTAAGIAPDR